MAGSRTIGAGIAIVAAVSTFACSRGGGLAAGDKDTEIQLSGNPCAVASKEAEFHVGKGKKVKWTITNGCDGQDSQIIVIGNFRENEGTTVNNCLAGVTEREWPFNPEDQSLKTVYVAKGGTAVIDLKGAKNTKTGNTAQPYFFDICIEGKKADPKMIVDP